MGRRLAVVVMLVASVAPPLPASAIGADRLRLSLVGPIRTTLNPQGGCIIAWKVQGQEYGKYGVVQLKTKGDIVSPGGLGIPIASSRWKMSNYFEDDARPTPVTWGGQSVVIPPSDAVYDLKITLKGVRKWRLHYKVTRRYTNVSACGGATDERQIWGS